MVQFLGPETVIMGERYYILLSILQLKDVEVVYPDKVYDRYGVEKEILSIVS
jgi:hypothetical protein